MLTLAYIHHVLYLPIYLSIYVSIYPSVDRSVCLSLEGVFYELKTYLEATGQRVPPELAKHPAATTKPGDLRAGGKGGGKPFKLE